MKNQEEIFNKVRKKFEASRPTGADTTRRDAPGTFLKENKLLVGGLVVLGIALAFLIFIAVSDDGLPNYEDRTKTAKPLEDDPTYESDAVKVKFNKSDEEPNIKVEEPDPRGGKGHGVGY